MRLFRFDDPVHVDASALLAWYANETLDATEQARVERHVRECVACSRELEELRRLQAVLRSEEVEPALAASRQRTRALLDREDAPSRSASWTCPAMARAAWMGACSARPADRAARTAGPHASRRPARGADLPCAERALRCNGQRQTSWSWCSTPTGRSARCGHCCRVSPATSSTVPTRQARTRLQLPGRPPERSPVRPAFSSGRAARGARTAWIGRTR